MTQTKIKMGWVLMLAGLQTAAALGALTPDQILAKADAIRNPQLDYTASVQITANSARKKPRVTTYSVRIKGRDKTVSQQLTPEIDRGRILLMIDTNFWAYLPNVSKPLRISFQEKLSGEVSNGDMARVNFTGDYTPTILKKDTVGGKKCVVLDLKAKSEDVTYGRVVLWVTDGKYEPVQAEFYGFSGKMLKTCTYEGYKQLGGAHRPSQLVMRDAVNKDQYSVLEYKEMKVGTIPEKFFTKDYMKKLTGE